MCEAYVHTAPSYIYVQLNLRDPYLLDLDTLANDGGSLRAMSLPPYRDEGPNDPFTVCISLHTPNGRRPEALEIRRSCDQTIYRTDREFLDLDCLPG